MRALACLCIAAAANAAVPGFEHIFPAGGKAGERVEVIVAGKELDKNSPLAWCSNPKVVVLGGDKPKKYLVSIGKDAKPGPCLIRLHTSEGATQPRIFEVGTLDEVIEKEPNDSLHDAKNSSPGMNLTINGVLGKSGDVDTFAIKARKGRTIRLELHGYALGSPMDPAMRLLDDKNVEIAAGHDTHNLDPLIKHTPAADGTLFVQLFAFAHPPAADVAFKGSANHVYRLTISEEATAPTPAEEPKTLTPPATISGCVAKPHEEDVFTFAAKKGDDLQIDIKAQTVRSPLDAVLRIEDAEGKSLQQLDDMRNSSDPSLRWKAPKDGNYRLVVADRFHQGSASHRYVLSVGAFTPTLVGTLDSHAYRVEAGKSADVKLSIKTNGTFKGKLQARAIQLPVGVTAETVNVPTNGGEVKLTLKATAEASESQAAFSIEIVTSAPDAAQTVPATYEIPITEPRGDLLIITDTHPWLTVAPKAAK